MSTVPPVTTPPDPSDPVKRQRLVLAGILLVGLGAASAIYLSAEEPPDNPFVEYENSKRFSHDVQRMGGRMALVANDISGWFAGLWQGRQLAWTVAGLTLAVAMLYRVIAAGNRPGPPDGSDGA